MLLSIKDSINSNCCCLQLITTNNQKVYDYQGRYQNKEIAFAMLIIKACISNKISEIE